MKKISLIVLGFFIVFNLYAEEKMQNVDKLDVLDKQSKEFFNAITGLEKNYLEEQVSAIKNKKEDLNQNPNQIINPNQPNQIKEEIKISQEDYEKNVFTHQNEMARLTTDFTRTKKLKDLKIKSMYSFNGKDYVVLELVDETKTSKTATKDKELSANIEGRYIEGDNILGHDIIDINTRTKSVELYKKLDEEYGYTIYLSNYGISVSDLKKIPKEEPVKKTNDKKAKDEVKSEVKDEFPIKKAFEQVKEKELNPKQTETKESSKDCLYTVNKSNLNVRNTAQVDGKILRVLKINDQFSIKQKNDNWLQIDTIYKKISGHVMDVSEQNNWIQLLDGNVNTPDKNCK